MAWKINFHPEFDQEYEALDKNVQTELLAHLRLLEDRGHQLSRPHADTLNGSKHANMKELRFKADNGVWRFAFAFDTKREGIILCGADKSGVGSESKFYKKLIDKADRRFDTHLASLEKNTQPQTGKKPRGMKP